MPDKYIVLMDFFLTGFMTIISYLTGLLSVILLTSWTSFFGLIPTILATLYWLPKIKKQIHNNHNGSVWRWIKSFVKKN